MKNIIKYLHSFVESHINNLLTIEPNQIIRKTFCGLPINLSQDLFQALISPESKIIIQHQVCVVLYDPKIKNTENPILPMGGICNEDYIMNLRNTASVTRLIIILPSVYSLFNSLKTSVSSFGFNSEIGKNGNKFQEDPLLDELVKMGLDRLELKQDFLDVIRRIYNESLSQLDKLNNSDDENLVQWKLLSNLWEINKDDQQKLLKIIALSGIYPFENEKFMTSNSYRNVLNKIGTLIEKNGISPFFKEFIENEELNQNIKDSLQLLNDHIHRHANAGVEFNYCPSYYYSPYIEANSNINDELPKWWINLTREVWEELLGDEEEEQGLVSVSVINSLSYNSNKCIPFTKDEIIFEIKGSNLPTGEKIGISRKVQAYNKIGEVSIFNEPAKWTYTDIQIHKSPLFFKFIPDSSNVNPIIKVYSLSKFAPGIAFFSSQAEKITMLSDKTKKRKGAVNIKQLWQSEIRFTNSGLHEIEVFFDENRIELSKSALLCIADEDDLNQTQEEIVFRNVQDKSGIYYITINADDESILKFKFKDLKSGINGEIEIIITISDNEAKGATSIIHKLIQQNLSPHGINEKIDIQYASSHLHQLQYWQIKDKFSFVPLVLGTDFALSFEKPNWESQSETILSKNTFNNDFRGNIENYSPPKELIEAREKIQSFLDADEVTLIEKFDINQYSLREDVEKIILSYLNHYNIWYNEKPENAAWFDTISIVDNNGDYLDSEPLCILLNPLHPVRLSWILVAQKILFESLNSGKPCPAAGTIDSSSVIDLMALPCFQPGGNDFILKPFISLNNDSYTWSILWHGEKLNKLKDKGILALFSNTLGINIEGIESGLTLSQIEHSIDDISKIKCAKSKIKLLVSSDSAESTYLNEGIFNWVKNRLGPKEDTLDVAIKDIWFEAGPSILEIYDTRNEDYYPEPEKLSDVNYSSHGSIKWFNSSRGEEDNIDLSIIGHLGTMEPKIEESKTYSNNYYGCIRKNRIKHILHQGNSIYFSESRTSNIPKEMDYSDIGNLLTKTIVAIEEMAASNKFGNYRNIPKISMINECLEKSDYCVVSSSAIDPSAFFDPSNKSYIWDYDLPKYASQSSANTGFYLLARNSKSVKNSVINGLKQILTLKKDQKEEVVSDVLLEISTRGIPTLKRLASGGNSASGELGMVIALRLLQKSIVDKTSTSNEIIPFKTELNIYNLIIPVDPFQNQLDRLMKGLGLGKNRPDLLIMSFYESDGLFSIKFTPIEVKFRGEVTGLLIKDALDQNKAMIDFLIKLDNYSKESKLWSIARNHFYANIIDFAFRTYGRNIKNKQESIDWSKLQYRLIQFIFDNNNAISIDKVGRLIILANNESISNDIRDEDADEFSETIIINKSTAVDLLLKQTNEDIQKLSLLHGWNTFTDISKVTTNQESVLVQSEKANINQNCKDPDIVIDVPLRTNNITINEKVDNSLGICFKVGHYESLLKKKEYIFNPSNTNLNQLNIGIVGDLGTGKTQLIKSLIYQISNKPECNRGTSPKFLILDTKRDYDGSGENESNTIFLNKIKANVVKPYKLPINLFDIRNSIGVSNPAYDKARFFIDILRKIYGGIGAPQESNIRNAVMLAFQDRGYESNKLDYSSFVSPTLNDVFNKYKELNNGKIDSPYSIMEELIYSEIFQEDAGTTVDFNMFFNQSTVISLGQIASLKQPLKIVLIVFLNLFREYMLSVKKEKYIISGDNQLRKIDSFLLIDEANLIMEYNLPVLEDILLKGREFGIGVILASQYLSHFRQNSDINYTQPLLTWFIHKVPNITSNEINGLGIVNADASYTGKIQSLKPHHCLYKSLNVNGEFIEGDPFYKLIELEEAN